MASNKTNKHGNPHSLDTRYFTVDEVATHLRCSRYTILNWIKDGTLAPTLCLKKRYLIPETSVERMVAGACQ